MTPEQEADVRSASDIERIKRDAWAEAATRPLAGEDRPGLRPDGRTFAVESYDRRRREVADMIAEADVQADEQAGQTVTLPSGLTVKWPKGAIWLHETCPERREHSPFPRDFNPGSGVSRTHRQARHATCGLWALWVPRADGPTP